MLYPNQKIITVNTTREFIDDEFTKINSESVFKAMSELSPIEFKMYLYLMVEPSNNEIVLSTKYAAERTGASKRGVQDSIVSLIKKGYLQQVNGNNYIFHENPISTVDLP